MLLGCCCGPVNPCGCTWPKVLDAAVLVGQAQSTFYFNNQADSPETTHTLTWGPLPGDIPSTLELYYYNSPNPGPYYITMPANAWFSAPVPSHVFTVATKVYFYGWIKNCQMNVMVIDAPYGTGSAPTNTKGAGNGVGVYQMTSCTPFELKAQISGPVKITGTHGGDDIVPDAGGSAGYFTDARSTP